MSRRLSDWFTAAMNRRLSDWFTAAMSRRRLSFCGVTEISTTENTAAAGGNECSLCLAPHTQPPLFDPSNCNADENGPLEVTDGESTYTMVYAYVFLDVCFILAEMLLLPDVVCSSGPLCPQQGQTCPPPTLCPIPGCGRSLMRLWNHLFHFHKSKGEYTGKSTFATVNMCPWIHVAFSPYQMPSSETF